MENTLSFDKDIFALVLGLEYSKEYVSLPDHKAVKDTISILDIVGVLYDDLLSKLIAGGKKGRERNICYTRYMSLIMEHLMGKDYTNNNLTPTKSFQITSATFKKPTSSEVPLTSHMRKKKTDKERRKKKIPSSYEPNASKDVSPTPIPQTFKSYLAEETEVTADTT
ncbi:hypothetical protein Tco_0604428 [Tanacetum coccineum]